MVPMSSPLYLKRQSVKKISIHLLSQNRSLYSTRRLFEEAFKRNHNIKVYPPLDLSMQLDRNHRSIYFQGKEIPAPDCVIPRMGQHKPAYILSVIRQYELMSSFSLNPSQAMDRSRDKFRSLQVLTQTSLGLPRTFFLDNEADIANAIAAVGGAPLIIKASSGTQGKGVMLAESSRSAKSILESLLSRGTQILVQEFITESSGIDTRVIVLGDKVIAAMKRSSIGDDFRSNLHLGATSENTELSIEMEKSAIMAASALGLQFSGVDIVNSNRGPLILEVNPSPGLEGIENSTGKNIAEECIKFLEKLYKLKRIKKDSIGY